MNLTKEELNRLAFLLGKYRHVILNKDEISEIRNIINKEQEHKSLVLEETLELGCIIVGAYTILETYEKMKANYK